MDMEHLSNTAIRDLLSTHAKTFKFRVGKLDSPLIVPWKGNHFLGVVEHNFCKDKMVIYVSVSNNRVILQHYGDYCALAHASAEIFCDLLYDVDLKRLHLMLEEMKIYFSQNEQQDSYDCKLINMHYPILESLMRMPMSVTRKRCIMLPWEATMNALEI